MDGPPLDQFRRLLGAGQIRFVELLAGSSTASMLALDVDGRAVVAKRYDRGALSEAETIEHVEQEADRLRRALRAGLPVAEVVAIDPTGACAGHPTIVMTRLPGRPQPTPIDGWAKGFATTLRRIVDADVDDSGLPAMTSWRDPDAARPAWFPERLHHASVETVQRLRYDVDTRFVHRDFHTLNVLWSDGAVSGIVDWVHACVGPIGYDIAACRVNMALTGGLAAADEFTAHCGALAADHDPAWDLEFVLGVLGVTEVFLNGNRLGANLTPESVRTTLVDMARVALARA